MTLAMAARLLCTVAHLATCAALGMTAGEAFWAVFLAASPDLSRMAGPLKRRAGAVAALWAAAAVVSAAALCTLPTPVESSWG